MFRVKTVNFPISEKPLGKFSPLTEYEVIAIKDSPAYVSFFIPDDEGVIYSVNEQTVHKYFRYVEPGPEPSDDKPARGRPPKND